MTTSIEAEKKIDAFVLGGTMNDDPVPVPVCLP